MHDTINLQELCRGQWFYEQHYGPDELRSDGCSRQRLIDSNGHSNSNGDGSGNARHEQLLWYTSACAAADGAAHAGFTGKGQ